MLCADDAVLLLYCTLYCCVLWVCLVCAKPNRKPGKKKKNKKEEKLCFCIVVAPTLEDLNDVIFIQGAWIVRIWFIEFSLLEWCTYTKKGRRVQMYTGTRLFWKIEIFYFLFFDYFCWKVESANCVSHTILYSISTP